jgi:SAM-dependent methyltransferase
VIEVSLELGFWCFAPAVKLSQKIGKLRRSEFYRRGWRRVQRKLHPLDARRLLAKLDQQRVREIQARYVSSPVQVAKYANIEHWIKINIERVQDLQLHRSPPREILDLGCGGGFFLFICQQLGHRCLGLDLEWFPLFTELLDLFQLERKTWEIKPFEPLPDLGRKFDWITAFSTGFNRIKKSPWGAREWEFFLNDLEARLRPGGKIFFALNPEGKSGRYYSDEVRDFFLSRGAEIERERICLFAAPAHGRLGSSETAGTGSVPR